MGDTDLWPPEYDEGYLPDAAHRYWCAERETMASGERDALVLRRLQAVVRWAWTRSAFYREKWSAAGAHPHLLRALADLHRFPVVTKDELRREEAAHPPFGRHLCIDRTQVARIHGTS